MKRSAILWLVLAACLILIGGAVFCLAMTAHHWDFSLLSSDKMETRTIDVTEGFQSISILSETEDIAFRPSDDGTCRVICAEKEKERHSVSVRNGTLTIEREDTRKWYDHIAIFSFGSPTITVCLPQADYASLFIEGDTGDVTIPEGWSFGSMDIGLGTGGVDCRASASGRLRIRTGTGDIRLEGLSAGELDLTVSTGRADVRTVACAGEMGLTVKTGRAALTDVSCQSLRSDGNTGSITLKNVLAAETIAIERSTGDVRFDGCDAGELTVVTDTGDVTGSLLSDKVFIAHSDTGRVEVPGTASGGICRITTDTGTIRITVASASAQ